MCVFVCAGQLGQGRSAADTHINMHERDASVAALFCTLSAHRSSFPEECNDVYRETLAVG